MLSSQSMYRKLFFSLIPITFLFLCLELSLRIIDFHGTSIQDIRLTSGFQLNAYVQRRDRILGNWFIEKEGRFHSNPYLIERGFHSQSFAKDPSNIRIFTLGGSTTYGSPFEHEQAGFAEVLERKINIDTTEWEFINWGVAGMDSSTFPSILKEMKNYSADAIIIYAGNNEITGQLIEQCSNPHKKFLYKQLHRLRSIQLLEDQYRRFKGVTISFTELSEHQNDCMQRALKEIQESSLSIQEIARKRFAQNIQESINIATKNNTTVFLIIPPINLLAKPKYTEKGARDPFYFYSLGMQELQHNPEEARRNLEKALELDQFSQRITIDMQKDLRSICQQNSDIYCIDLDRIFREKSPQGIARDDLFHDFCHPTKEKGTNLIVDSLLPVLLDWRDSRQEPQ